MKREDIFLIAVLIVYMFVILGIGTALTGCGKLDARDGHSCTFTVGLNC